MNEEIFDVILDVRNKKIEEGGSTVTLTGLYDILDKAFKNSKYNLEIIPCVNGHHKLMVRLTEL